MDVDRPADTSYPALRPSRARRVGIALLCIVLIVVAEAVVFAILRSGNSPVSSRTVTLALVVVGAVFVATLVVSLATAPRRVARYTVIVRASGVELPSPLSGRAVHVAWADLVSITELTGGATRWAFRTPGRSADSRRSRALTVGPRADTGAMLRALSRRVPDSGARVTITARSTA